MSKTVRRPRGGANPYPVVAARLPRGPHSLSREQVAANQRVRIGMAMLEAIGERGYVATTVSEVVARAGVSRKAFYQQFTNKEECFLATYDAIVKASRSRFERTFLEARGESDRMQTAIRALFEAAIENPDALRLAITEIAAVGTTGIDRRERLILEYGRLINDGLRSSVGANGRPHATVLPDTTLRAVVGGLNWVLVGCLHAGRSARPLELVPDLARWVSSYHPVPRTLQSSLRTSRPKRRHTQAERLGLGGRAPGTLSPRVPGGRKTLRSGYNGSRSFIVHNQRERILDAVTNLTAAGGYGALTVEDIASEACVSLQAFYEHFESKEDAFLVAYELGHTRGLDIVERAFAAAPNWRTGVRDGLRSLMSYLASEPSFARLALIGTTVATPRASELADRGVSVYAQLLTPGFEEAPEHRRPPAIAIDAIAGGLREIFLCCAAQGRIHELPGLAADATYIALAPFIGPQAAAQVATRSVD